jgi:hypothetical protein
VRHYQGCDDFCSIEEYGKAKQTWFEAFLDMPYGIPRHDTFNDVLNLETAVDR